MYRQALNGRTDPKVERLVVARIAAGVRHIDISEETALSVSTIKKISARNRRLIAEVRLQNIKKEVVIVVSNLQKAHKLLAARLDRAIAGQEEIPVKDLISIAKEMHHQSQTDEARPPSETANQNTSEQSEALRTAVEANDTETIVSILFSKNKADA